MNDRIGLEINRVAGWLALGLMLGLGGLWAWDRWSPHDSPRFAPAQFAGNGPQAIEQSRRAAARVVKARHPIHAERDLGIVLNQMLDQAR